MARVKFGVAEDEKMMTFWEERLKRGDESAKDVYGFLLWEKFEPRNKFERSVSSLQSRARRIVPQLYLWNWKVGRKLAIYKMWQKSFTDDRDTLRAIEKYCKVDITLYRDGTIKSWTHKSKANKEEEAALVDAGSERVVIENSDEEMQTNKVVQSAKKNASIWVCDDEEDEVVQPPKKKLKPVSVSQLEIENHVVEQPLREDAVVLVVDGLLDNSLVDDVAPGAILSENDVVPVVNDARKKSDAAQIVVATQNAAESLDYTHVSLADSETMNFTLIIEALKKTYDTNHEMREFLGKPPISTPPHKKNFDGSASVEPLQTKKMGRGDQVVPTVQSKTVASGDDVVPVLSEKPTEGEKDKPNSIPPASQPPSNTENEGVVVLVEQSADAKKSEKEIVGPAKSAPPTSDENTQLALVTPEFRNEAFNQAFKRLRESGHVGPENVPQFRAVESRIQADGLTQEEFCEKLAVEFQHLSASLMVATGMGSTKVQLAPVPHLFVGAHKRLQIASRIWINFNNSAPANKLHSIKNFIEKRELMILLDSQSEEQYVYAMKELETHIQENFVDGSD